ncbi:MAG: N-6 DNA methylase, partial [Candidatus Latescibacterota bacterium]|nr:N-6 DNA methylase [Candidatus Latescibacterota bacterium]
MVVVLPDFLIDLADFVELLETGGFDQWLAETDRDLDTDLVEFLREHLTDVEPDREILRCAARAFRYALDNHYTDCILLDEALDALNVLSPVQTTTSEPVVALISELIGNLCDHGGTVADLACGEATLLTSLLEQDSDMADAMALDGGVGWGPDGGDLDLQKLSDSRFLGIEIDRDTAAIAHIRLMLHNSPATSPATADWHIQVGNSLAVAHEPAERFDTVIVDPPTTKTKAWLNLAKKSLTTNPASRAFVLLPSSALAADGPCASLRKERRLEAIVHLPNRFKKDSRGLVLCLITGESTSCEEILHIDLADLKIRNPYYGPVIPLLDPSADSLPDALPAGDVCAAISHWRETQTINEELLPAG